MEKYTTEGTSLTPKINFDFTAGILEISGRCVPENSRQFFLPFFEVLNKYALSPKPLTKVVIELEYFNTSSSKEILDVFRVLMDIKEKGNTVNIFWRYEEEDEEMRETGVEYQLITDLKFEMVPVKDL